VKKYGTYCADKYPVTDSYYNKCLSIPLYPKMSDEDVERVIQAVSSL
jgi:dTDP-4-amino-4,6-dideoxygalactose transaminase